MKISRDIHYSFWLVILDIVLWGGTVALLLAWRVVADKLVITRYLMSYGVFCGVWLIVGFVTRKYRPWRYYSSKMALLKLLVVAAVTEGYSVVHSLYVYPDLSIATLPFGGVLVFGFNAVIVLLYYSYRYATYMDVEVEQYAEREPAKVLAESEDVSEEQYEKIEGIIVENSGAEVLEFLKQEVPLRSSNTLVFSTSDYLNVKVIPNYRYSCVVNLKRLNELVGINKFFCAVNEELPDDGLLVCTFVSQEIYQKGILEKYPPVVNRLVYDWNIFFKRIVPRTLFRRWYFKSKSHKKRFISNTEVLGRLYYCGFEVLEERTIGEQRYIVARRKGIPHEQSHKRYGMVIKLPRVGKNGEMIDVFKFRTMHPYSEYIQEYIYKKNKLEEGGKIKDDIRVTHYGSFMRRYWLDELPMLINLVKGEMKLVGVRPISKHYYSLYSKELQQERIKYRPGLLPPFYVDMPKTLEEIEASEMRYLKMCESDGVLRTDFRYFWKIVGNILFKHARSK